MGSAIDRSGDCDFSGDRNFRRRKRGRQRWQLAVNLEDGTVEGFDIRAAKSDQSSDSKTSFTLHAHDKAVCTVSYNPLAPNVKLWDLSNNQPSCVASNNPKAGAIFSISFSEDSPFLQAIGGSKGKLEVALETACYNGGYSVDDFMEYIQG
ncbi:putative WD repeat-containing protein C17D11.16 [Camellia lanceoleosa]|uniref:WD repeat-containing protein C17D11.16 n=1 Tax=Camellia lanceoleosa TaxID=1840588 RepID=A0ACC0IAL2_9ERIC|nr:putative WD repeat-containing protein C17D11.16 [Camellia lanceoleosa]